MDFSLTPEQKELQSVAREFAQKEMTSAVSYTHLTLPTIYSV